jgi:uncharacterized protein YijF (DUF1287 family)
VVARARREAASKSGYDPKYYGIPYPGGDVPGPGVCTDLVVRALRAGGVDLQKLVHEDRRANLTVYPDLWQPRVLDSSIDHRRVANLMCFFRRKGSWLKTTTGSGAAASWRAGDLVFWELSPGGRLHCGVVSDRSGPSGRPMVIHNLSAAAEEDCLTKWKVIGHARWTAAGPAAAAGGGAQPASRPRAAERKKTYSFEDDPEAKG